MKIYFRNKEGIRLAGILTLPTGKTETCIILCHGATVDKEEKGAFTELARVLTNAGFATFRFDFRGHGESGGNSVDMTVKGESRDLDAAFRLMSKKRYNRFGLVAASFGGGAASLFVPSHQGKIKALIYWNSALDYKGLARRWLANGEAERLRRDGFIVHRDKKYGRGLIREISALKPYKELRKLRISVLFIHGDKDTHVPYKNSVRFSKMIGAGLVTLRGSEHGFHVKRYLNQATLAAKAFFISEL